MSCPAYQSFGDGDVTLVLLHGIGGNRSVWPAQVETFVRAGYRVVAWDMPGYGESAMPDASMMAALADALDEMLHALGSSRCVLVGHSMGGMVAQEWMARHGSLAPVSNATSVTAADSRVEASIDARRQPVGSSGLAEASTSSFVVAMVLCGTSPAFGKSDGDFQREFVRQRTAPLDAGKTMRDMAEAIVPGMLGQCDDATRDQAHALAVDAMAAVPEAAYRVALQALVAFDQRAVLGRLALPVLLVAGEHDGNAPPKVMARMAEAIPHAQYVCLPGAGHLMNLTHASAFDNTVLSFLAARVDAPGT